MTPIEQIASELVGNPHFRWIVGMEGINADGFFTVHYVDEYNLPHEALQEGWFGMDPYYPEVRGCPLPNLASPNTITILKGLLPAEIQQDPSMDEGEAVAHALLQVWVRKVDG